MYLGLTGNIASGKSTAAEFFEKLGCYCIDTDNISREVMSPEGEAYPLVIENFGDEILLPDKTIDRQKLRKIVFEDKNLRKKLEQIVQPAILRSERKMVGEIKGKDDSAVIITQAALTIEAGTQDRFDGIIVVYTDPDTQIKRLMKRDSISKEDAVRIIDSQMDISEKLKYADFIINNSGGLENLRSEVERVYKLIKLIKYGIKNS